MYIHIYRYYFIETTICYNACVPRIAEGRTRAITGRTRARAGTGRTGGRTGRR